MFGLIVGVLALPRFEIIGLGMIRLGEIGNV